MRQVVCFGKMHSMPAWVPHAAGDEQSTLLSSETSSTSALREVVHSDLLEAQLTPGARDAFGSMNPNHNKRSL